MPPSLTEHSPSAQCPLNTSVCVRASLCPEKKRDSQLRVISRTGRSISPNGTLRLAGHVRKTGSVKGNKERQILCTEGSQ